MSTRLFLFFACLALANGAQSSNIRSLGMATSGVSLSDEIAILANPASPGDTNTSILQAYVEDRYGIGLLRNCGLAYATAARDRRIGLEMVQTGKAPYRSNRFNLSAGIRLFNKSRFGISLRAYHRSVSEQQQTTSIRSWGSSLGWWFQPFPKTSCGLVIDHPESISRTISSDIEQPALRYGFSWSPLPVVNWSVEAVQRSGEPIILASGLRYQATSTLGVSCGWRSDRMLLSMGSSVSFKTWRLDFYFEQHRQLGTRTGAALLFFLHKRS